MTIQYNIVYYVAQIGDTGYETLAEAIAAAQNGDTVKLLSDVNEAVTISGKTLTLDLNGNNITSPSSVQPIKALNAAKLTITNSNVAKSENTPTQNAILGRDANGYGSLLARDEGTAVDIKAGYYYGYTGNKTAIHAYNGATVTFYDCVVNGAEAIEGDPTTGKEGKVFYSGLENPMNPTGSYPGTIIVHGGNFSGRMSDSNWGNYVIDGGTFDRNEVVINENPVDANGDRVATASGSMTKIKDGTLDEAGWLVDGFLPVDNGDGTFTVDGPYAAEVNGTGYETFAEAVAARTGNDDVITLLANYSGTYTMDPGKLIVDKNGFTFNKPTVEGAYVFRSSNSGTVYTYTTEEATVKHTASNDKVTYYTASDLAALNSDGTYQLLTDITRTQRMAFGSWASDVTIDLNGHTLTSTAPDYAFLLGRTGSAASPKTFALVDNSNEKGGKLVFTATPSASTSAISVSGKYNEVTIGEGVTVEGGAVALLGENQTLTVNGTIDGDEDFAIVTNGANTKNATITVNDGAVVTADEIAMYLPGTGTTTINGGTITGDTAIYVKSGTLAIKGGTITGNGDAAEFTHSGNGAYPTGDAVVVESCNYGGNGAPTVTISGSPTINSTNGVQIGDYTYGNNALAEVTATSNTMTLPEDLKWVVTDTPGVYEVAPKEYVAQIGDAKYESLAEAIAAAADDDTITVIADCTVPCYTTQITGKDITIDATGYTVTGEGYTTFPMFNVKSDGGLTLTGGTFSNPGGIISNSGTAVVDGATLTAGGFAIQNKGDLTVNSGTITATEAAITNGATTAETTITGGTFTGKLKLSNDDCGTFAVSGGTFDRPVPAEFCDEGYIPNDNGDGTYGVVAHIHNYNSPSFNWTQDPATGEWDCDTLTLSCSCGDSKDYEVTGFFGASAVTCTANADGSFTYSASKKVDAVTYADSKTLDANGVIKTVKQLKAAAKLGGEWELGADIESVQNVACANGFVLDGNDYTVYNSTSVKTSPVFKPANKTAGFTLKNLTIDGTEGEVQYQPAISSLTSANSNVINLENVTITNYDFDADNNGAVLAWGSATVNLTDCDIDTDSQYDVWAGAAATVNIDGGEYGDVYLHGGTASATIDGDADVDAVVLGYTNYGEVSTGMKVTVDEGTVGAINNLTGNEIVPEQIVMDPDNATVAAPEGYEWIDSDEPGMKTLALIQEDLFLKHSISLNGDIALNFYLNPDLVEAGDVVNFAWTVNGNVKTASFTLSNDYLYEDGYKATVNVPAAEMTYDITASVEGYAETNTYSVCKYANDLLATQPNTKTVNLVNAMLDYGAKAQVVFNRKTDDLANEGIGYEMVDVTDEMVVALIKSENNDAVGTDLAAFAERNGMKYYNSSLMYLSKSTLRNYFTPQSWPGTLNAGYFDGNQANWYYYKQQENIPARDLSHLYTFTVGNASYQYSALDYVREVLKSNMTPEQKDLAKATYWYNLRAIEYFT